MAGTKSELFASTRWGNARIVVGTGLSLAMAASLAYGGTIPAVGSSSAVHPLSSATWDGSHWGDPVADKVAKDSKGKNKADADPGSLYTIETAIGARKVWALTDSAKRQITGKGVTVALLDSGTAPVPGLNSTGKVTYGPDLSIEGNGVLTDQDTYGHGTHMAGIIAAHDPAVLTAKTIPTLDPSVQLGVAPDAGLLSLKLATTDGSTDVTQVIAALNWITEHQTSQDGTKVRVVNLSFGTATVQPYQLDPLAAAAENAWRHGLVVVVSGGNDGNATGRLTDPAMDPYVLAVGASDGLESVAGWQKPSVAAFSNGGSASRHVDLVAPGTSIASLRAPSSFVDVNHPEGLVAGDTTGRLFRGSGTSQAAAVVSGAVALLLQAHPTMTPDQVKSALVTSATHMTASTTLAGAGQLNVAAAMDAVNKVTTAKPAVAQSFSISTGQGSIQATRGLSLMVDPLGLPVVGETDIQGNPWVPALWWAKSSTLTSWSGGTWMGATWTGDGWAASLNGLLSSRWSSSRWSSSRWSTSLWDSSRWSSSRWSSSRWSFAMWSSSRWSDSIWG
jgi:serine protease AprX